MPHPAVKSRAEKMGRVKSSRAEATQANGQQPGWIVLITVLRMIEGARVDDIRGKSVRLLSKDDLGRVVWILDRDPTGRAHNLSDRQVDGRSSV